MISVQGKNGHLYMTSECEFPNEMPAISIRQILPPQIDVLVKENKNVRTCVLTIDLNTHKMCMSKLASCGAILDEATEILKSAITLSKRSKGLNADISGMLTAELNERNKQDTEENAR